MIQKPQTPPSTTQTNVSTTPVFRAVAVAGLLLLALSGCSDVKRSLGYEKAPPDEFQVVARAPLAMPPDFNLRPPTPGATRPQEGTTTDQARAALLGERSGVSLTTVGRDSGDMALLTRAGANQAQPGIRQLVDKESQALAEGSRSFTDKLVFWRKPPAPGDGEQLDAAKEAQRLRENQALGRPVTAGETPRIERTHKGFLEGVF